MNNKKKSIYDTLVLIIKIKLKYFFPKMVIRGGRESLVSSLWNFNVNQKVEVLSYWKDRV